MITPDQFGRTVKTKGKTDEIDESAKAQLEAAVKEGICPVPLKLKLMRHYWNLATNNQPDGPIVSVIHAELAAEQATDCAPYIHPKIASLDLGSQNNNPLRLLFAPEDEKL